MEVLGQVIEIATAVLSDAIAAGLEESSPHTTYIRARCAIILNKLPLTSRALLDAARADPRFGPLLFYERTRLGVAHSGHFLEGLPAGLPLFSGERGMEMPAADLANLHLRDVLADKARTVANLEKMQTGSARMQGLLRNNLLSDLPPGLPGRVHIFVSRMRAVCQGLAAVKPASEFAQCKNCECSRLFYVGSPQAARPPAEAGGDAAECAAYWVQAAGVGKARCSQRQFCTWACCEQWQWQMRQALPPDDEGALAADVGCRKEGRFRVSEALRMVTRRNEAIGRSFRAIQKERRAFPALSGKDLAAERRRRVRMLNVDLGLLFAASIVADSSALSKGKVLPATTEGWRTRPLFYARALREIGKLYARHHEGSAVVASALHGDPFLMQVKAKAKAGKIF
jgi:hypothetical protein